MNAAASNCRSTFSCETMRQRYINTAMKSNLCIVWRLQIAIVTSIDCRERSFDNIADLSAKFVYLFHSLDRTFKHKT